MDGSRFFSSQRHRDADAALFASQRNESLLANAQTRYKVGDQLRYAGYWAVEIVEVFPVGYIAVPGRYGFSGEWLEPISYDVDVYRFRGAGPDNPVHGETTEEGLSPLDEPTVELLGAA